MQFGKLNFIQNSLVLALKSTVSLIGKHSDINLNYKVFRFSMMIILAKRCVEKIMMSKILFNYAPWYYKAIIIYIIYIYKYNNINILFKVL